GGLIRKHAARNKVERPLQPLIQPPAALNSAQRQPAFADQRCEIFDATIFVAAHPSTPTLQAFADAGCHSLPVILLAVFKAQFGAQRRVTPDPLAAPAAKPIGRDHNEGSRAPSRAETAGPGPGEHLGQRPLQDRDFVASEAVSVKWSSMRLR